MKGKDWARFAIVVVFTVIVALGLYAVATKPPAPLPPIYFWYEGCWVQTTIEGRLVTVQVEDKDQQQCREANR